MERVGDGMKSGGMLAIDIVAIFAKKKSRRIAEDDALRTELAHLRAVNDQLKREHRENARVASTIGGAFVGYAEKSPDFKLMLKQVLASAALDDPSRKFLAGRGWV